MNVRLRSTEESSCLMRTGNDTVKTLRLGRATLVHRSEVSVSVRHPSSFPKNLDSRGVPEDQVPGSGAHLHPLAAALEEPLLVGLLEHCASTLVPNQREGHTSSHRKCRSVV